ncbi:MAG: ABC transporter ATP-binding protein [Ruminiclostridium sp.]|nr:ABC transporter ATP-binding protein [Ruminiclostridium sp.]
MKNKGTLVKVLRYIKRYIPLVALSMLLAALTVAGALYIPIIIGRAIDLIIEEGRVDLTGIAAYLLQAGIVAGATALLQWLMGVINNRIAFDVVRDIRSDAFRKIEELPLSYLDTRSTGDIVSRVISDADQFADGLLLGFSQLFTGVVTILGTLVFMLMLDAWITLAVVVLTPVSLLVARFISTRTYSMFRLRSETLGEQTALIDEIIGNEKTVKAFCREDESTEKFEEINERLEKCSLRATFFSSLTNPCTRFVNSLVYAAVLIFGALAVIDRGSGISVGELSCFLSYANQYTKPFNEISGVVTELQNAFACAARLFELIEEPSQSPDPEDAVVLSDVRGSIRAENVSFSYVPDKKLIESFNIDIKPGQRVAVDGDRGRPEPVEKKLVRTVAGRHDRPGAFGPVDGERDIGPGRGRGHERVAEYRGRKAEKSDRRRVGQEIKGFRKRNEVGPRHPEPERELPRIPRSRSGGGGNAERRPLGRE